jgi:methylmalonyl-CoA mutase N-terminal domain/subunit
VANVVDPFGGSYLVEKLTKDMEDEALAYFDRIDRMGGMVDAIERGFPQQEIAESAYRFQQAVERKEKIIVGANAFVQEDDPPIEILYIDESAAGTQLARLDRLRKTRDSDRVRRSLDALRSAAQNGRNVMPAIMDAVRTYATLGEMCDALRDVWGEYEEIPVI